MLRARCVMPVCRNAEVIRRYHSPSIATAKPCIAKSAGHAVVGHELQDEEPDVERNEDLRDQHGVAMDRSAGERLRAHGRAPCPRGRTPGTGTRPARSPCSQGRSAGRSGRTGCGSRAPGAGSRSERPVRPRRLRQAASVMPDASGADALDRHRLDDDGVDRTVLRAGRRRARSRRRRHASRRRRPRRRSCA